MNNLYRKCVGIVLINKKSEVLVGERIDISGVWQFPQGGVLDDELESIAVRRELEEEVGVKNSIEIICAMENSVRYIIPNARNSLLWDGAYIGQDVTFYLVRFDENLDHVDLNSSKHPEFKSYKWIPINSVEDFLMANCADFKKDMYKRVIRTFIENIQIIGFHMPIFSGTL